MATTNPARRLFEILRFFKQKKGVPGRQLISEYFNVEITSNEAVYSKMSNFYLLIRESERKIESIDDEYREKVLLCFKPIKTQLNSIHIDNNWNTQLGNISESDLGLLEIGADLLDKFFEENEIEHQKLNDLVADTHLINKELLESDVDPKVKGIIVDLLEGIRISVSDYKLSGVEGLKKILAESFGRLALDHEIVKVESEKPSVKMFWDILSKINVMISSADKTFKVTRKVLDFLQN